MNVLIACEESQAVCKEFRKLGHRAFSCDLQECSGGHPEWHIHGDVVPVINGKCEFQTQDTHTHTSRRVGSAHSASALHISDQSGSLKGVSARIQRRAVLWTLSDGERGEDKARHSCEGSVLEIFIRGLPKDCGRESFSDGGLHASEAYADYSALSLRRSIHKEDMPVA